MSERKMTHNGRDTAGNFKVKQLDVDDVTTNADGANVMQDDIRLGGAVEDTGATAGQRGEHIGELVDENREDVAKVTGRAPRKRKR